MPTTKKRTETLLALLAESWDDGALTEAHGALDPSPRSVQ